MTKTTITEQFAGASERLPGPADFAGVRRAALERFTELGLPNRRIETWHYTDLGHLAGKPLDYFGAVPDETTLKRAEAALAPLGLDGDAPCRVFVDGHLIESLSHPGAAEPGLVIESLAEAPAALLAAGRARPSALEALNTAFLSAGASIRVTGATRSPVQLVFIGSGRGRAVQLKLGISLEANARATVVEHFIDLAEADEAWLNLVTEIEQAEGSGLTLYRLQQHGPEQIQTTLTRASLAATAALHASSVELGGGLVRNELEIALTGREARAEIRGLALTDGKRHCDTRVAIDHRAAETTSRQDYRAIAAGTSRSIFNGKVTVREDAQHIDARQRNDNLLLSAGAEIDSKPELEIYADQVVCSHGATVGELDEHQLFYLRSRGIDAETARGILTAAFADVILDGIGLETFRETARDATRARLPRRVEMEATR